MNTKDQQECQSDEDQGIGEVKGYLTKGGELGGHFGEPLACGYLLCKEVRAYGREEAHGYP